MMAEEAEEERKQDSPEEEPKGERNDDTPKDHYTYRSLGDEVKDSLFASLVTYFFAELRNLAKQGKLEGEPEILEKIMNLPIRAEDLLALVDVYTRNAGKLGENEQMIVTALMRVRENNIRESIIQLPSDQSAAEILVYDDDYQDSQCVYLIAISRVQKRVVVAFRGSVTTNDFIRDCQAIMRDIPAHAFRDLWGKKSEIVGIHHGFQEYLFGQVGSSVKASKTRKPARRQALQNRCETIINHVAKVLEENPDYRLFVTGHSLGGALATAFAFFAADSSDPRIPKPVTCISIASPKVGNLSFRLATEILEQQRKLRMLRVANVGDVVTLFHQCSCNCFRRSCFKSWFRHVGMKLILLPRWKGGYRAYHPGLEERNMFLFFLFGFLRLLKHFFVVIIFLPIILICSCMVGRSFAINHSLEEYLCRLDANMDDLTKLYLNDLYDEYLPAEHDIANVGSDIEMGEDSQ